MLHQGMQPITTDRIRKAFLGFFKPVNRPRRAQEFDTWHASELAHAWDAGAAAQRGFFASYNNPEHLPANPHRQHASKLARTLAMAGPHLVPPHASDTMAEVGAQHLAELTGGPGTWHFADNTTRDNYREAAQKLWAAMHNAH